MTSEGSREIEAARKRLTAAKTQASAASKHKEMIAKLMQSANSMSDAADKEVEEAEIMLKDAEKRWDVIHIDDIDSPKKDEVVVIRGGRYHCRLRGTIITMQHHLLQLSKQIIKEQGIVQLEHRLPLELTIILHHKL